MKTRLDPPTAAAILTTVFFWASAFAGIRMALRSFTPGHLVLLRFATASVGLAVYAAATRMRMPERRDLPFMALLGMVSVTIYHLALVYGQRTVSAGAASFLINAAPVFTALLAGLFLRERLTGWGWAGIGASFLGVVLISVGQGKGFRFTPGALLILGAAVCMSASFVLQKPYFERYRAIEVATYAIWAGTAFLAAIFLPGLVRAIADAPPRATAAVIYLGVFPAALANVAWTYVLSRLPTPRAASYLYLVPPLAVVVAWLWLGEIPGAVSLVGGSMALGGVALTNAWGR